MPPNDKFRDHLVADRDIKNTRSFHSVLERMIDLENLPSILPLFYLCKRKRIRINYLYKIEIILRTRTSRRRGAEDLKENDVSLENSLSRGRSLNVVSELVKYTRTTNIRICFSRRRSVLRAKLVTLATYLRAYKGPLSIIDSRPVFQT